jgi:dihydroneopterin aldolase
MLASVASADEAEIALDAGADIIDLKDPTRGALGALPAAIIGEAVARVVGRRTTSATAGDLAMIPSVVDEAVARIGGLGVDIVKVGLFPGGDRHACLDALARHAERGMRLVAVMFADRSPDFDLIGAMLDTADKRGGGLRRHLDDRALGEFVRRARACGLMSGLAGSLCLADIAPLLPLAPDYLGFRGALCAAGRDSRLDPERLRAVRAAIPVEADRQPRAASKASAAAGAHRAAHSRVRASASTRLAKST